MTVKATNQTERKPGMIVLEIVIILVVVFIMSPVAIVLINAFKTFEKVITDPFGLPNPIAWENFPEMWKRLDYINTAGRTLAITVFGVAGIILFSSMAAWRITRYPGKISNFVYFLFIAGMIVPFQTLMIPLVITSSNMKMIGTLHGIIVVYWGLGMPQAIFLISGFVKGVPRELEEAASIDGCSQGKLFFRIVLPLLKPIIITVAILDVLWLWNDYLLPLIYMTNLTDKTLMLCFRQVSTMGNFATRWELAMAGMLMVSLPIMVFYIAMQKHIMAGLTRGALKG